MNDQKIAILTVASPDSGNPIRTLFIYPVPSQEWADTNLQQWMIQHQNYSQIIAPEIIVFDLEGDNDIIFIYTCDDEHLIKMALLYLTSRTRLINYIFLDKEFENIQQYIDYDISDEAEEEDSDEDYPQVVYRH